MHLFLYSYCAIRNTVQLTEMIRKNHNKYMRFGFFVISFFLTLLIEAFYQQFYLSYNIGTVCFFTNPKYYFTPLNCVQVCREKKNCQKNFVAGPKILKSRRQSVIQMTCWTNTEYSCCGTEFEIIIIANYLVVAKHRTAYRPIQQRTNYIHVRRPIAQKIGIRDSVHKRYGY